MNADCLHCQGDHFRADYKNASSALVTDSLLLDPEIEDQEEDLEDLLLEVLPGDGTTIGNLSAREAYAPAIFKRGTFKRSAPSLALSSPYFSVVAVAENTLNQFLLVFPESGSSVLKSMRIACTLAFLLLFPCSSAAIAQLRKPLLLQRTLTVSCLLQYDGNKYMPAGTYRFNFDKGEGSYSSFHGELNQIQKILLKEFKFTSGYFPSPERYLYWQSSDFLLGRPDDSYGDFNLQDNKKEALMLFYERYRYDINAGELQMIRRGFSNWDKGEADENQYYWQTNAKWKCSKVN